MLYTNAKDLYKSNLPKPRFKGSSLPKYFGGGWIETANYFMGSEQGQNLLGGLGKAGNLLGAADAIDGDMNPYMAGASGALKGAQLGAKLGSFVPGIGNVVGAVGGAAIGAGAALLQERKQEKMREEAELQKKKEEENRRRLLEAANMQASKAILSTYPTSGVADAGFMLAMGGKIPTQGADYLAEGGEIIQHAVNDRPDTDANGDAKQINSNTSKFVGDSHDDPSEGIGVANDQEARIYSNRLYAPKDLVAQLKKL